MVDRIEFALKVVQVLRKRKLVGTTFEKVHQVAGSIREHHEVATANAGGKMQTAERNQFGLGAVGSNEISGHGVGAIQRCRDQQRIDEKIVVGRSALRPIHRQSDQAIAVGVLFAKLDSRDRHPATVEEAAARFTSQLHFCLANSIGNRASRCLAVQDVGKPLVANGLLVERINIWLADHLSMMDEFAESMVAECDRRAIAEQGAIMLFPKFSPWFGVIKVTHREAAADVEKFDRMADCTQRLNPTKRLFDGGHSLRCVVAIQMKMNPPHGNAVGGKIVEQSVCIDIEPKPCWQFGSIVVKAAQSDGNVCSVLAIARFFDDSEQFVVVVQRDANLVLDTKLQQRVGLHRGGTDQIGWADSVLEALTDFVFTCRVDADARTHGLLNKT